MLNARVLEDIMQPLKCVAALDTTMIWGPHANRLVKHSVNSCCYSTIMLEDNTSSCRHASFVMESNMVLFCCANTVLKYVVDICCYVNTIPKHTEIGCCVNMTVSEVTAADNLDYLEVLQEELSGSAHSSPVTTGH